MESIRKPTRPMKPRPPASLLFNVLTLGTITSTPPKTTDPSTTSAPSIASTLVAEEKPDRPEGTITSTPPTTTDPSTTSATSTPSTFTLKTLLDSPTLVAEEEPDRPEKDSSRTSISSPRSSRSSSRSSSCSHHSMPHSPSQNSRSSLPVVSPTPSLISPLHNTPPKPAALKNKPNSPSEKLKKLQAKRRKSFLPPKICSYIFKRSSKLHKQGDRCTRSCLPDEVMCSGHLNPVAKTSTTCNTGPIVKPSNTRINRLLKNQKYFYIKTVDQRKFKVLLKCGEKHFTLRLPRTLVNPQLPTSRDYLIRDNSGITRWQNN